MTKGKKALKISLLSILIGLMAAPAFAKSISLQDAGITVWVFIIIGSVIVLLQLIPAAILFFSLIGTGTSLAFRGKKKAAEAEEKELVPAPAASTGPEK
jgi:hypothetical protein